jgi:DMSO/TMAO reductase YedYZ molybdopterin-dependent catalytic subunit
MSRNVSRRALVAAAGGGAICCLGARVVHARRAPPGFPFLFADAGAAGKEGLTLLSDRPLNLETPPHLLDDETTPARRFFVRDNGLPPANADAAAWRLRIDGEVDTPLDLSIADLERGFETVTLRLALECGGNGRKFFRPEAAGQQWTFGAVGFGDWTGVRLAEILRRAGARPSAVYTGHYGADRHLSGDPGKIPISRGVPIEKAMEPHTLIAFGLNGGPLPAANGHPLRLVVPGWPGSCSQKWLTRVWVRERVHDGEKMQGDSYRVPKHPIAPGAVVAEADFAIIEDMPVKSLITFPATGAEVKTGEAFEIRGHAWSGETALAGLDYSLDFGATWARAELAPPKNRYAPQRWRARITLPRKGYYEIAARARDAAGRVQPFGTPGWNPKGYVNNMQHRIAVFAT